MSPNIPLLRKYVEWVEWQETLPPYDPNRDWNQAHWFSRERIGDLLAQLSGRPRDSKGRFTSINMQEVNVCRTSYCVAGRTVLDAGYGINGDGIVSSSPADMPNKNGECVSDVARDLLGITEADAGALFAGNNTARRIRSICQEIAYRETGENLF